jgi:hypothetical protein
MIRWQVGISMRMLEACNVCPEGQGHALSDWSACAWFKFQRPTLQCMGVDGDGPAAT